MDLRDYLLILWHRKSIAVIVLLSTLGAAVLVLELTTPVYTAVTTLRLATGSRGSVGWEGMLYAGRLMNTYASMATSDQLLARLRQEIPSAPPLQVESEIVPDTELIEIRVEHTDPALAQSMANMLASLLISEIASSDRSTRAYPLVVADVAAYPRSPSYPRRSLVLALASVVAVVASVGLVFLAENVDTRLYSTAQIAAATGGAAMARIPSTRLRCGPLVQPQSVAYEAFRQLRTALGTGEGCRVRSLVVTSATPGEGVSLVALNLAYALAQVGQRVVLVDANLRHPTLHTALSLPNESGLTQLLRQERSLKSVLKESKIPGIDLLPSGPVAGESPDLLGSPRMQTILMELGERYDVVVVDSPATVVADALVLAALVEAAMLVVQRGQARRGPVEALSRHLRQLHLKRVGVVINRAERDAQAGRYLRRAA